MKSQLYFFNLIQFTRIDTIAYQDSATNNTLLIHIDNRAVNSDHSTLVKCTDFFSDNRLTFTANSSAIMSLWSNLGRPTYTTGTWNSQTYTTTLALNDSSIAELDWNPGLPRLLFKILGEFILRR